MIRTVNDYGCGVIALLNVSGHIVLLSRDLWRRCNRFLKKEKSSPASPKKSYALNTRLHPPLQAVSLPFFSDSFPVSRYTRSLSFAWWLWNQLKNAAWVVFSLLRKVRHKVVAFSWRWGGLVLHNPVQILANGFAGWLDMRGWVAIA